MDTTTDTTPTNAKTCSKTGKKKELSFSIVIIYKTFLQCHTYIENFKNATA